MKLTFTAQNCKYHKENYVQNHQALIVIMYNKKKEEPTGKRKIQGAITLFFPE